MLPSTTTKLLSLLFCFAAFTFASRGQAQDQFKYEIKQVDSLFSSVTSSTSPGVSVIIISKGSILLKKGYGMADIDKRLPVTQQTIFRLGSITKQFTAMAIMKLYDEKKLLFDDYTDKFLPGLRNGKKITIRHLLTHTSGISESADSDLVFEPGEYISYSNTGYNILGRIIEKVSGLSYEEYLQKNIFQPLGMDNTGYEHSDPALKNFAKGYRITDDRKYINSSEADISRAYAAGALYSTVEDMYRWDQALYSDKLAKLLTLNQAFSQVKLNDGSTAKYGFGWMIDYRYGLKEVGHGGDITGFNSYMARFPEEQFSVIVLSNVEMRPPGPLPDAGVLAHKISEIFLKEKIKPVEEHLEVKLESGILDSYTGEYKWVNASRSWTEASGEFFTISKKGNRLLILSKMGEAEVYAMDEDHFFMKDNSIITFTREDHKVTGMTFDAKGLGIVIIKSQKLK